MGNGRTSVSDGFEAVWHLFNGTDANNGRENTAKIVLFLSDGEQTIDTAPNKTLLLTAVDAADLVKDQGASMFAWGFGDASLNTLQQIATWPSKAILVEDLSGLTTYLKDLEAAICNEAPP